VEDPRLEPAGHDARLDLGRIEAGAVLQGHRAAECKRLLTQTDWSPPGACPWR
jgi:hypothetical protein